MSLVSDKVTNMLQPLIVSCYEAREPHDNYKKEWGGPEELVVAALHSAKGGSFCASHETRQ